MSEVIMKLNNSADMPKSERFKIKNVTYIDNEPKPFILLPNNATFNNNVQKWQNQRENAEKNSLTNDMSMYQAQYKTSPEYLEKESKDLLHRHSQARRYEEGLSTVTAAMEKQKKIHDEIYADYMEAFELAEKYGYKDIYRSDLKEAHEKMMNEGYAASEQYVFLYNQKRELEKQLSEALGEYSSLDELYGAYERKKASYKSAKEAKEWKAYMSADDFAVNSAYSEDYSKDELYQYINGKNTKANSKFEKEGYGTLTNTEIGIYNYKRKTEGRSSSEKFLESLQERIRYRRAEERFESYKGNSLKEHLFAFESGWEQFVQNMDAFFTGETDVSSTQYLSSMVREDLADDGRKYYNLSTGKWETVKILGSSTDQIFYDLTGTVTTMVPSILTSVALDTVAPGLGKAAGVALIGMSSYGGAYFEATNLGYTEAQARTYATLVGASEASLQYVLGGIGKLGGKYSISSIVGKIDDVFARVALSGVSEGIEEGVQGILEPWFKQIAGMDFEAPDIEDVLYNSLLGFLMGTGFSAMESAGSYLSTEKYFNNSAAVKNLIAEGLELPEGSLVRKLAETYIKKFNNGKTPTKSEVGEYVAALKEQVKTEYAAKAQKTAQTQLIKKGETLDVGKLAGIIKKAVSGQAISAAEAQYLHKSSYGEQLLNAISTQVSESVFTIDLYVKSKLSQNNPASSINSGILGKASDYSSATNNHGNANINAVKAKQDTPQDTRSYEMKILEYLQEQERAGKGDINEQNNSGQNNLDFADSDGYNESADKGGQEFENRQNQLTYTEKQKLKQETGWSDEAVDAIRSVKEAEIYKNAGLKETEINGKKYLIRDDIDFEQRDNFGLTNRERIQMKMSPYTRSGKKVELHHIGQRQDSPLAELTMQEHRGKGNDPILHDKKKQSEINRSKFDKERTLYWKTRMENILNK